MVFIVISFLLLLSAFFSASETALLSISTAKIHLLYQKKRVGSSSLKTLRENPGKMLTTILIGNNLANISASTLFTLVVIERFKYLNLINISYLTAIVSGVMTIVVLIFCEVTPKNVAMSKTETMALFSAPIINLLATMLTPVIILFNFLSTIILKLLKGKSLSKESLVTEEEIMAFIDVGEEQGILEEEETKMLKDVIEFGDTTVKEVMTPLNKVISANITRTLSEVIDLIERRPHSRIPIYESNKANIVGLLYAKDMLLILNEDNIDMTIREFKAILRKPFYVDENEKVSDILELMRTYKAHLAIVRDINKKSSGIVTIEDILEEIVGEIRDEYN